MERRVLRGRRGRSVDLDAGTVTALKAWRERQAAEQLAWPGEWGNVEGLVFTHKDGTPLHPDSITKLFKRRVAATSAWNGEWRSTCPTCSREKEEHTLPPLRGPYAMRHTWATLALEDRVHIKVVQERLGHSSIAITGDVYSHVTPGMQAEAATRVARIIDAVTNTGAQEADG